MMLDSERTRILKVLKDSARYAKGCFYD